MFNFNNIGVEKFVFDKVNIEKFVFNKVTVWEAWKIPTINSEAVFMGITGFTDGTYRNVYRSKLDVAFQVLPNKKYDFEIRFKFGSYGNIGIGSNFTFTDLKLNGGTSYNLNDTNIVNIVTGTLDTTGYSHTTAEIEIGFDGYSSYNHFSDISARYKGF